MEWLRTLCNGLKFKTGKCGSRRPRMGCSCSTNWIRVCNMAHSTFYVCILIVNVKICNQPADFSASSGLMFLGFSSFEQRVQILRRRRLFSGEAEPPRKKELPEIWTVQNVSKPTSVSLDELAASVNTISQKIVSLRGSVPLGSKKSSRHLTFNNHLASWWKHAAANWSLSLGT